MIPLNGNKQIQIKMQQERKKIRDNHWAKKRDHWPIRAARRVTPWPPRRCHIHQHLEDFPRCIADKHRQTHEKESAGFKWTAQKGVIEAAIGKGGAWHYMGEESEGKTVAWLVGDEPRPEDAETYRRVRGRGHLGERLARRFVEKRLLMERKGEMGLDTHTHTHTICRTVRHTRTETVQRQMRNMPHKEVRSQFTQMNKTHMHKLTALMYEGVWQEVTWDDQ